MSIHLLCKKQKRKGPNWASEQSERLSLKAREPGQRRCCQLSDTATLHTFRTDQTSVAGSLGAKLRSPDECQGLRHAASTKCHILVMDRNISPMPPPSHTSITTAPVWAVFLSLSNSLKHIRTITHTLLVNKVWLSHHRKGGVKISFRGAAKNALHSWPQDSLHHGVIKVQQR